MRRRIFLNIGCALIVGFMVTTSAIAEDFQIAQVWHYDTRPIDTGSTLTIVKIDVIDEIRIIHISLEGVKVKNQQAPSGYGSTIGHLPIEEETLKNSVTKLVKANAKLPDFEEGYKMWKEAFDNGNGGYFTIPVSECVEYIEQAINQ